MKKVKIVMHIVGHNSLYELAVIEPKSPNFFSLSLFGLIIGFINGFFGGGGGMVCVPVLNNFVSLEDKKSHATAILIMLPLCVVSFVMYIVSGVMDWSITYKCTIGFVVGGVIGALILKNIANLWLNILFAVVIIAGGIKLLI